MPEGPEVKIIGDELKNILINTKINSIDILSGKYYDKIPLLNINEIRKELPLQILDINVKGKMIYFVLENGWYMFNTLGMSGTWTQNKVKHCHIELTFSNNDITDNIWFFDIRRFGNLGFSKENKYILKRFNSLGPDMLSKPPSLEDFISLLRKKNKINICKVIMDQSVISGCGNYIKCEVLYKSKISPFSKILDLSNNDLENLYNSIIDVITRSYQFKGTTLSTYKQVNGQKGEFSDYLEVYNKKYTSDGNLVEKIKTPDNRSTYWVKEIQS